MLSAIECILEPSAGTGSFLKAVYPLEKRIIAYDIDPKDERIQKADFLQLTFVDFAVEKTLAVGNPPFRVRGSMARKFLNKCFAFCNYVCMILPASFQLPGMMNGVDPWCHIKWHYALPGNIWINADETVMKRSVETHVFFMEKRLEKRAFAERFTVTKINCLVKAAGWELVSTKTSNKKNNADKMRFIRNTDIAFFIWGETVDCVCNIKDFNTERYHVVRMLKTVDNMDVLVKALKQSYAKVREEKKALSTIKGMVATALPDILKTMNIF